MTKFILFYHKNGCFSLYCSKFYCEEILLFFTANFSIFYLIASYNSRSILLGSVDITPSTSVTIITSLEFRQCPIKNAVISQNCIIREDVIGKPDDIKIV